MSEATDLPLTDEFYIERNDALIESPINRPFDELLLMSDEDFEFWAKSLRAEVARIWKEQGAPPIFGFSLEQIESDFNALSHYATADLLVTDELTARTDCLLPLSKLGSACRAFFPNMAKTKDITTKSGKGYSLWDYFTDRDLFQPFLKKVRRHLKKDGFYAFSPAVTEDRFIIVCYEQEEEIPSPASGQEFIKHYFKWVADGYDEDWDFWLDAKKTRLKKMRKGDQPLAVTKEQLTRLRRKRVLPERYLKDIEVTGKDKKTKRQRIFSFDEAKPNQRFTIRGYDKGQKIFPKGFRAIKAGLVLGATNFPATVAKYLYERFTDDIKHQDKIVIYDPSAGFGGRLLGALSAGTDRQLHYVGTDPNTDNWLRDGMSRYEALARFYQRDVLQMRRTTYEFYRLGSEEIRHEDRFKKYRGKLDLVFTSPPYFGAEGYSDDASQSHIKFPEYDEWRDGRRLKRQ
jgi:hypothetical protein